MTITCNAVQRLWAMQIEGHRLENEDLSMIAAHVATCPACRREARVASEIDLTDSGSPPAYFEDETVREEFIEKTLDLAGSSIGLSDSPLSDKTVSTIQVPTNRQNPYRIAVLIGAIAALLTVVWVALFQTAEPPRTIDEKKHSVYEANEEPIIGDTATTQTASGISTPNSTESTAPIVIVPRKSTPLRAPKKPRTEKPDKNDARKDNEEVSLEPVPDVPIDEPAATPLPSHPEEHLSLQAMENLPQNSNLEEAETDVGTASRPIFQETSSMKMRLVESGLPIYPSFAKLKRIEGIVRVELHVDRNGKVTKCKFLEGDRRFIETVKKAVRLWWFDPFYFNGEPIETHGVFTYEFKLED